MYLSDEAMSPYQIRGETVINERLPVLAWTKTVGTEHSPRAAQGVSLLGSVASELGAYPISEEIARF